MTYQSIQPAETGIEGELERLTHSVYLYGFDEDMNNPILSLDSGSRIAFLLHHLLGYRIEEAASLAEVSEEEFRANLRSAYLQLLPSRFAHDVCFCAVGDAALA